MSSLGFLGAWRMNETNISSVQAVQQSFDSATYHSTAILPSSCSVPVALDSGPSSKKPWEYSPDLSLPFDLSCPFPSSISVPPEIPTIPPQERTEMYREPSTVQERDRISTWILSFNWEIRILKKMMGKARNIF